MEQGYEIAGYRVMGTLGYGARSTIYAVQDKGGQDFALKVVQRKAPQDDRFLEQAIKEHEIANQFNHPILRKSLKLHRHRLLFRLKEVRVVMEYVDGSTLEQEKPRNLVDLLRICAGVCDGLQAMHDGGYVHADIKPNNIIVTDDNKVKVIDFGQSCPIGTVKERIQGTPDYIAPEQVKRERLTAQTDVFNLGATMYWLMTNDHIPTLIPKENSRVLLKQQAQPKPPHEINASIPPALSSLVMSCVREDMGERPNSMDRVKERIRYSLTQIFREQKGQQAV